MCQPSYLHKTSWTQDCKYKGLLLGLLFDIGFVVFGGLGVNNTQEHGVIGMLLESVLCDVDIPVFVYLCVLILFDIVFVVIDVIGDNIDHDGHKDEEPGMIGMLMKKGTPSPQHSSGLSQFLTT